MTFTSGCILYCILNSSLSKMFNRKSRFPSMPRFLPYPDYIFGLNVSLARVLIEMHHCSLWIRYSYNCLYNYFSMKVFSTKRYFSCVCFLKLLFTYTTIANVQSHLHVDEVWRIIVLIKTSCQHSLSRKMQQNSNIFWNPIPMIIDYDRKACVNQLISNIIVIKRFWHMPKVISCKVPKRTQHKKLLLL